jgi:hypothetical protein
MSVNKKSRENSTISAFMTVVASFENAWQNSRVQLLVWFLEVPSDPTHLSAFSWGKVQTTRGAENSAVLFVHNVNVRTIAEYAILFRYLRD